MLPVSPSTFMLIVGVIEIAAGLAVLTRFTRFGAYVVMAWLLLIAINLVIAGYLDIAVRDVVMAVGAFAVRTGRSRSRRKMDSIRRPFRRNLDSCRRKLSGQRMPAEATRRLRSSGPMRSWFNACWKATLPASN